MNQVTKRMNEEFGNNKAKIAGAAPGYQTKKNADKQSAPVTLADAGEIKPETGTLPDGTPPH